MAASSEVMSSDGRLAANNAVRADEVSCTNGSETMEGLVRRSHDAPPMRQMMMMNCRIVAVAAVVVLLFASPTSR